MLSFIFNFPIRFPGFSLGFICVIILCLIDKVNFLIGISANCAFFRFVCLMEFLMEGIVVLEWKTFFNYLVDLQDDGSFQKVFEVLMRDSIQSIYDQQN